MKSSETRVRESLLSFHGKLKNALAGSGKSYLSTIHDEQWPSPCEKGEAGDGQEIFWDVYSLEEPLDFTNIEQALDLTIHQSLKDFFGWFYSDNLAAKTEDGALELLQPWNSDDFERLQENLIGHVLMKQKLKQEMQLMLEKEIFLLAIKAVLPGK